MLSNLCSTLDLKRPDRSEEEEGSGSGTRQLPTPDEPQPVLLILQQTLPILQNLLSVWILDVGVVEVRTKGLDIFVVTQPKSNASEKFCLNFSVTINDKRHGPNFIK